MRPLRVRSFHRSGLMSSCPAVTVTCTGTAMVGFVCVGAMVLYNSSLSVMVAAVPSLSTARVSESAAVGVDALDVPDGVAAAGVDSDVVAEVVLASVADSGSLLHPTSAMATTAIADVARSCLEKFIVCLPLLSVVLGSDAPYVPGAIVTPCDII